MTDSVRKDLKEMNDDSANVPGGFTNYIQVPDMSWNNPFKARMTESYDQWLNEGVHQFTEGGNMKLPPRKRIIEWLLDTWSQLYKENNTKSFKCCCLNFANHGTEDEFIHCLRKRKPCKAGRQKLNSQLSIF